MERTTEKSNIVYLRLFKDPADNDDTMQRVSDFLSEMFDVGKVLKYLVVLGMARHMNISESLNINTDQH